MDVIIKSVSGVMYRTHIQDLYVQYTNMVMANVLIKTVMVSYFDSNIIQEFLYRINQISN